MSKNTGGQAFPMLGNVGYNSDWVAEDGMTLRDYFAAKAMTAIVRRWDGLAFGGGINSPQYRELARDAYIIADVMLEARDSE